MYSFIHLFIYLFIHSFIYLFSFYCMYICICIWPMLLSKSAWIAFKVYTLSVHAFPENQTHDFDVVWSECIREHIMFSRQHKHAKINTNVT